MTEKPLPEHEWLQKLVGEWTFEADCEMGPDQPTQKTSGTETVRSLGGLWTLADGHVSSPDGEMTMTLGYDPARQCFVGTFIASCMTHLWVYEGGTLDTAQRVLTLNAEGPDFTGGTAKYHDIIELISDDERTLSSEMLRPDGTWHRFMTTRYRRKR
ncbi:MAG: DUF1579 domain-containing protein [Acidobacteriota bacterium]